MRTRRSWLVIATVVIALSASIPGSAVGFGTIDSGGQNREHERITRAALACTDDAGSDADCLEPQSMDALAGHGREFGAIGAPDRDELSLSAAHCDNADFLAGDYPQTRDQATAAAVDCIVQLQVRFEEGVRSAANLLDEHGQVIPDEVNLRPECHFREPRRDAQASDAADGRAKCTFIEGLGRVLHGVQDFYAHSNWSDEADPARPIGPDNPPGLNLPGPSSVLDLRGDTTPSLPSELTTGCYTLKDQVPGVGECERRVTHAALNKDRGLIDPTSGATTDPTTSRGRIENNFAKAVAGAIAETRRQWQDLRSELTDRYGEQKGQMMICALTHDDPVKDCTDRPLGPVVGIVLLAILGIAAVVVMTLQTHRRRKVHTETTGRHKRHGLWRRRAPN